MITPVTNGSTSVAVNIAAEGSLDALPAAARARLFDRGRATDPDVERTVRGIIADVRTRGDDALRELALAFDGVRLDRLEVEPAACRRALDGLDPVVGSALVQAAANIATFHRAQLPQPLEVETAPGVRLGRRADPLRCVGVYAPGGRATYPSSVLMGVIPARVAGVDQVIVCSPPGPDGAPPAAVLAACALAGADRVFALGGAGAVAALALGTATVPRVDRVVGPGNAYVTEAKRQLTGIIGIDSPAGPSEILIIADDTADPTIVAAELLAQAEHDPDAAAVLVSTSVALCAAVRSEIERLLPAQPRADIIRAALAARGALLNVTDLSGAIAFAEIYAPEHLLVLTAEPRAVLTAARAAGTVFLGSSSSVAFGDYLTGANHVLPTAGLARAYAGLSTLDFIRWTTYQELSVDAAAALAAPTAALAAVEGLPAHALCARLRAGGAVARDSTAPSREVPDTVAFRSPAAPAHGPAASTAGRPVVLRAAYRDLAPYDAGRVPCDIDLSDNTNLFGAAPSVRTALMDAPAAMITRYPDTDARGLKDALAGMLGVPPACISTGCGSDDVIDSAIRAFAEPGDTVAFPAPTFGMIGAFAGMNAARAVGLPLTRDLQLDVRAIVASNARITYLCRPNNPTGTLFGRSDTERICREAAGVVLVDEAYADFADDDMLSFALDSERTIVLRTLSKAYGLAGLRIGYAVGPAWLIAELEKSRGPYKVSSLAEVAALSVLSEDRAWVRDRVGEVRENRDRLLRELRQRGVITFDSSANFVLLCVADAAGCSAALRTRGVAVRAFAGLAGIGDCLRVSIGPWPAIDRFLNAFDEVGWT